ncbi:ribosome small subunit-dependent GTPase A [Anaerotruncus massiliensis (ex Liu et al. 2021)]|uniref:Small ribosomal subunit biogenesis GTPase RsgA n=2 Tax=Anaerotruncus TaxID=244127 RepID=A0A498CPH4_9FIRM|nr:MULTISPECIES: ribosome small subunit-dependent GTPase A [Anaerotruncus]MBC3937956.1 ribosome small subunit-dependent GTPase A [Anaerotruncus massiliensis (ex Togo et al. 2019)]RLL13531.1 ribosome small subunit-dependent GTPase A [Anaerotruncus massiliensis (ex Liu et al. 2021)]
MNIEQYGFRRTDLPQDARGIPARITAVRRGCFEIVCDRGAGLARLAAGARREDGETGPTVGDFVLLDWREDGESRILETLPRRTWFSRRDPSSSGHGEQAVAANFDYVFILQPLGSGFHPRGLERYLSLAWQSGAVPALLLTKADAVEDFTDQLRAAEKLAAGTGVFAVSARTGYGLDQLADYLKPGRTVVFLGPSGAGKSTLVNALAGGEVMRTSGIREKDGRGRHTTTHRQLLLLENGVLAIDTPGMRELGMWEAEEGISRGFPDVEEHLGHCRFSDCSHQGEPGCAVAEAIRRGELSPERWESYRKLREESRLSGSKADFLREKQRRQKELSKTLRQWKKADYRHEPCMESFTCKVCGALVTPEDAGSRHRNHCPRCLSSVHVDNRPGDRASLCGGTMDPIGVWVRKDGEWALIHRCRACGALSSNRIAADDNPALLMSIAVKPLAEPPFPLWQAAPKKP